MIMCKCIFANFFVKIVNKIGKQALQFLGEIGQVFIFMFKAIIGIFTPPFYPRLILNNIIFIGYYSLPVVGMTAIFSGAVLALQTYVGFARFSAESSIPTVVVISLTRELGPVLAGLMVSGRVGASIAAEIGTMRVTEQIDALYALATDSIKYLVTPRIIATVLVLPCLVLVADIIGVLGGYLISVFKLGFNEYNYISNTLKYLKSIDVISGLVKAAVFGLFISTLSCFHGYNCTNGAKGVGYATTAAVVYSSIMVLLTNFLITALFFDL